MQLICKKKELLEIKEESPLLTFYYSNPNFSAKIFCQFTKTLNANYYGYQSNHGFS